MKYKLIKTRTFEKWSLFKIFKQENILLFLGIILIIPFILLSIYNQPTGDDFFFAIKSRELGPLGSQLFLYLEWTGRYFSTFVLSFHPLLYNNIFVYKLIPILLILSLGISLYYLIHVIFNDLKSRTKLGFVVLFLVLYFFQLPIVSQSFYWLPASITYQLASNLSLLLLGFVIQLFKTKKITYLVLSIITSFAIIGSNEVSMLIIDFIIVAVFILNYISTKKINWHLIILIVFAILFSLIVYHAPGNKERGDCLPNKHQFVFSVIKSFGATVYAFYRWMPMAIIIVFIFFDFLSRVQIKSKLLDINPLYAVFIMFSIVYLGYLLVFWSMGVYPPDRAVNVLYFFFVLSFFYSSLVLIKYLKTSNRLMINISRPVKYVLIIVILISLYRPNNIRVAFDDLISQRATNYNTEITNRFDIIKACQADTCYVFELKNKPKTIFFDDIGYNANDGRNQNLAKLMGVKAIVMRRNITEDFVR